MVVMASKSRKANLSKMIGMNLWSFIRIETLVFLSLASNLFTEDCNLNCLCIKEAFLLIFNFSKLDLDNGIAPIVTKWRRRISKLIWKIVAPAMILGEVYWLDWNMSFKNGFSISILLLTSNLSNIFKSTCSTNGQKMEC